MCEYAGEPEARHAACIGEAQPRRFPRHRSEADQQLICAACGATVDPGARVYGFAPLAVLCWDCSLARGGRYDAHEERWTRPPSVSDLAEPER